MPAERLRLRRRHGALSVRREEPGRAASSSPARSRRSSTTVRRQALVVACYSATAAALPALQEQFATPIIGVVMPGARAAVQTSRYRRIGVLATEATVASGATCAPSARLDGGAEVIQQACPGLVDFIEDGDVASHEIVADAVRGFTDAAQGAAPGRRHHGLHALPADRAHAAALPGARRHARQPGRRDRPRGGRAMLLRQGLERDGRARWARTASTRTGDVERVPLRRRPVPADAAHARRADRRSRRSASWSRRDQPPARPRRLYAALYAVLTLSPAPSPSPTGQVQFRVSEALLTFACVDPGGRASA